MATISTDEKFLVLWHDPCIIYFNEVAVSDF